MIIHICKAAKHKQLEHKGKTQEASLESRFPGSRMPRSVSFIYFAHFMQDSRSSGWRRGGNKSVRCHLAPLPFAWHLRVLRHF